MSRYVRGERIDVQAIAAGLGLGRATIYRWFGSRDDLIGEVLVRAGEPLLERARAGARGAGGVALLDTLDRFNRSLAAALPLRRFVEREREAALRVITSSAGKVQPWVVGAITELIRREVRAGTYTPAIEPATLAYAVVRLGEAFLYNDSVGGMRGEVDRLREVQAAMFGWERPGESQGAAVVGEATRMAREALPVVSTAEVAGGQGPVTDPLATRRTFPRRR